MSAAFALFLIDALFVAASWPLSVWLLSDSPVTPQGWALAAIFATINLVCLYALGFYRRDGIADAGKAVRRIPIVVAIAIVAANFLAIFIGWQLSPFLCAAVAICFATCIICARMTFVALRRH